MTKTPGRYDATVRAARDDGHPPDPAAFAVAGSRAASSRNASVLSAHTAGEIICVVGVAARGRPSAVAVAPPPSPARSRLRIRSGHPAGERPVPAVVRRFEEHPLPQLLVAAGARDADVSHAAAAPGSLPARRGTASSSPAPCRATAGDRTGRIQACSLTEKRTSERSCPDQLPRVNGHRDVHG